MANDIVFQRPNLEKCGNEMYGLVERLYPLCRSITGDGTRGTIKILQEFIPIEIREIPSGTKVFDWEIPDEWNISDAWIKNQDGKKIIDFKKLNLHVLNYSTPVDRSIKLDELKEHVFSSPEHPDWVPYRTSYHNRQWGFCLSHNQLLGLKDGEYKVKIDSEIKIGSLTYGEFFIPGKTSDEVLFSCHICHPSLCNDNLSGIVLAAELAKWLSKQELNYSYRFLFVPGTIGSIAWLSRNEETVKNIRHGLVLSLLGDKSAFHYKKSRRGNAEIDAVIQYLLTKEKDAKIREFSPYGYDERQYCSPGFNLPVGSLTRTPSGEFPEYHTSADNLDFIDAKSLGESLELLLKAVQIIETNKKYINQSPKGEPQLGRRGLYQTIGGQTQQNDYQMALLWVLNLSDGDHTILDIAKKSGIDFEIVQDVTKALIQTGLLKKAKGKNLDTM